MILELWLIYFFISAIIIIVGALTRNAPLLTLGFVLFFGLGFLMLNQGIDLHVGTTTTIDDINSLYTEENESFDYNTFTGANSVEINVIAYLFIFLSALGILASIILYLRN